MSSAVAARTGARLTGGLTERGLLVAYSVRLRNAAEQLDEVTRQRLLGDLRALVDEYCPRRPGPGSLMVVADVCQPGIGVARHDSNPGTLAALLEALPRAERRRFNATWRFAREAFAIVDQIIRRPLPGADQAEQAELLLSFLIWRLRLVRRTIRRARTGA